VQRVQDTTLAPVGAMLMASTGQAVIHHASAH